MQRREIKDPTKANFIVYTTKDADFDGEAANEAIKNWLKHGGNLYLTNVTGVDIYEFDTPTEPADEQDTDTPV